MSRDTPSTAMTSPEWRLPNGDSVKAKILLRLRTSSNGTDHLLATIFAYVPDSRNMEHGHGPHHAIIITQSSSRNHHPAIIGTAASAATIPMVRERLKCSCRKMRASRTVMAG